MAKIKGFIACFVAFCTVILLAASGFIYINFNQSGSVDFQKQLVSLYQKYDTDLSGAADEKFALKRLIVSGYDGKSYGAIDVASDKRHGVALLQYKTAAQAENAYNKLTADGYTVDADCAVSLDAYETGQMNPKGSNAMGISDYVGNFAINSDDVLVAVLDTGVMLDHDELKGRMYNDGYDYTVDGNDNAEYDKSCESLYFHGTFVSAIVANNTMSNVKIVPFKVVPYGTKVETLSSCISAIYAATDMGADVINASFSSTLGQASYEKAVAYAVENGVCVCASAGNNGKLLTSTYPAMTTDVITVSALNSSLTNIASYSNFGSDIDFCAPGSGVTSAIPNTDGTSGYATYNGTSFSAPYISAVCANIKSMNSELSKEQVYNIMRDFSVDYGDEGLDSYYGYGMPNIASIKYDTDDYTLSLPRGELTVHGSVDYTDGTQPWYSFSSKIKQVNIDENVKSIGAYSFYNMAEANFKLNSPFNTVGDYAFYGCTGLKSITFDKNVKQIGNCAFGGLSSDFEISGYSNTCAQTYCRGEQIKFNSLGCNHDFLAVAYPPSSERDGYTQYTCSACGYTYNDKYVEPAVLLSGDCGEELKYTLDNFGTLSISGTGDMYDYKGVASPWYDYRGSVRTVVIDSGVTSVSPFAFYGCSKIYTYRYSGDNFKVVDKSLYTYDGKTLVCAALSAAGEYIMPEQVESISAAAFLNAESLSVVPNDNFSVNMSVIYDKNGNIAMALPSYKFAGITIESAVKLMPYAFLLTSYPQTARVYSSGVEFGHYSIGYSYSEKGFVKNDFVYYGDATANAYSYAVNNGFEAYPLNAGKCGENVNWHYDYETKTLSLSGQGATDTYSSPDAVPWYDYMSQIKAITIDDEITALSQYSFYNAKNATALTMPASMEAPVNQSVWYGCSALESITLTKGSGVMPDYDRNSNHQVYTYSPWYISRNSLQNFDICSDIVSIGAYAFRACSGLKTVTLNNCDGIGKYAFYDCVNIESFTNYSKQTVFSRNAIFVNSASSEIVPVVYCYNDSTTKDYIKNKNCSFSSLGCGHTRGYTENSTLPNCCYDVTVNYNCVDCNETIYSSFLAARTSGHYIKASLKSTASKAIYGAEVYVNGQLSAVTNQYGKFVIDEIKCCQSYNITIKKHGFVIANTTIAPYKNNLRGDLVIKYGDFIKDGVVNGKDFGFAHLNRFEDEKLLDYGYVENESLTIDRAYTNQGHPVVNDIYNEQSDSAANKREFYAHVSFGTEYTVTECGYLYGKNLDDDFMTVENVGKKGSGGYALRQYQFEPNGNTMVMTYGSSDSKGVVSARFYIKYTNGVKNYIYYSDISSYTY